MTRPSNDVVKIKAADPKRGVVRVVGYDGIVEVSTSPEGWAQLTPDNARRLAWALIAAADREEAEATP